MIIVQKNHFQTATIIIDNNHLPEKIFAENLPEEKNPLIIIDPLITPGIETSTTQTDRETTLSHHIELHQRKIHK